MKLVCHIAGISAVLFFGLLASATAAEEKKRPQYVIGEQHSLQSEILGEERTFWVGLPESYERSAGYRRYPVLYFLDGNKFFHPFTGVVQQLSSDATPLIPEMIVVGIASQNRIADSTPTHSLVGPDGLENQDWSVSGGGEAFQRFLAEELIPHIEASYSTSDYRILAGYSLTGLPVLYNLLTRPNMFDAHIAMDSSIWWDDFMIVDLARGARTEQNFSDNQLVVTTTAQRYPSRYLPVSMDETPLVDALSESSVEGLSVAHRRYERETHHSLATISLYDALVHIFNGHMMTLDELYLDPEAIPARFERLSERLGHDFRPPEGVINFFGYNFLQLMTEPEPDKALLYFRMNVDFYPQSSNAWDSLGEGYAETGATAEAIAAYERALELDPDNENSRRMLDELVAAQ